MQSNISGELADRFASLLRVPREQISLTANVLDLGADSIMLLEARSAIEARYGRRIEIRRFFEDLGTIEAIAAFLAEAGVEAAAAAAAPPPPADAPSPQPASGRIDIRLMRAQLALVADVIEAQNRVAGALRGQSGTPSRPAAPEGMEITAA